MNKSTSRFIKNTTDPNMRKAYWITLFFGFGSLVLLALALWQTRVSPSMQSWAITGLIFVSDISIALGLIFLQRVQIEYWARMTFIPWLISIVLIPLFMEGLGWGLLFSALAIMSLVSSQTIFIEAKRPPYILSGVAFGVLALLVDTFTPTERVSLPGIQSAIGLLLTVSFLILGILVFQRFRDYSLQNKLLVGFLLSMLIPMGLTVAYVNSRDSKHYIEDADETLLVASAQTSTALDAFVNRNLALIDTSSHLYILGKYLELPASERSSSEIENILYNDLQAIALNNKHITSVGLMDRNGIDVADTFTEDIGLDKSNRDFFQEPLNTKKTYVSPIQVSVAASDTSLYFSAPVLSENGSVIGILRIRFSALALEEIIRQSLENANIPDGSLMLIDEHQIILMHSTQPDAVFKTLTPLPDQLLRQLQEASRLPLKQSAEDLSLNLYDLSEGLNNKEISSTFTAETLDEETSIDTDVEEVALSSLKAVPWVIAFSQPQSTFFAPLEESYNVFVINILLLSLLVVSSTILYSRTISHPLMALAESAQKISEGNLDVRSKVNSQDEIGRLADTFNQMAERLRNFIGTLEQRVAERTKALSTSNEVSRRLSTIIDERLLVKEVVEQVQAAFNYYHAHIYLYNNDGDELLMAGGTGEVGQILLSRGHKIPKGKGLVGRAGETNTAIWVPNTSQDSDWLPNPLLPETRSEIAVPIASGDAILGVLDVQHNITDSLTQTDVDLLQSIASQVAIAVQNARSYAKSQQRADHEALKSSISQKIQGTTSIESAMQVTLKEVKRSLGIQNARVILETNNIDVNVSES